MTPDFPEDKLLFPEEKILYQRLQATLEKFSISTRFSREALQCQIFTDGILDDIVLTMTRKVPTWGKVEITVPETWWDGFKAQYFPAWLKKRFPVRYITHKATKILPELPMPFKGSPEFVSFDLFTSSRHWKDPEVEE
jgi:hypothetical protein